MSLKALYAAATGMEAQEVRINNIANNLSNLNTPGFKADRESFEDLMYDQIKTPGAKSGDASTSPIGVQIGHGVKLAGVYKQFTQGEFNQTNRELDVAIQGNGFFQVTLDNGNKAYTRDGSFRVNATGELVNNRGLKIDPSITIPIDATSVTVSPKGIVSVIQSGSSTPSELGTIQLVTFQNPSGLQSLGGNLYTETAGSGTPTTSNPGESGAGEVLQGFLENSNVNIAEELINMIIAQRSYEANSKVMSTTSEMMRSTNSSI